MSQGTPPGTLGEILKAVYISVSKGIFPMFLYFVSLNFVVLDFSMLPVELTESIQNSLIMKVL